MRTWLVVPVLLFSRLASAQAATPVTVQTEDRNFRIQVEVEYDGMKKSADFLVQSGAQSNYVEGGSKHFPISTAAGEGMEFKKWGFIVNALPSHHANDPKQIVLQLQIEVTGPVGRGEIKDPAAWQYQSSVLLRLGKKLVLSQAPAYAAVTVTEP